MPSKHVLNKAGLTCLDEMAASASAQMVWKSKKFMDPLGKKLFPTKCIDTKAIHARSANSERIKIPVPGYSNLAVNLMATAWNENSDLRSSITLGSAIKAAKQWARSIFN